MSCDFIWFGLLKSQRRLKLSPLIEKFCKKYLEIDKTFNFGHFKVYLNL